ncbi:MAG: type II toxin-antitoxin system RelE/ParE family toxin [Hormoscilla sp. SP5CHS1]|nr:type II toxin-antitoxin system RelE/ParE family toxin [Hormoscilla sp. SP5CHS1]
MHYSIYFTPAADRAFRKLEHDVQNCKRIAKKIESLKLDPRPAGFEKVKQKLKHSVNGDLYKVRTGDYRIIYQIDDLDLVVTVVDIKNRDKAYPNRGR